MKTKMKLLNQRLYLASRVTEVHAHGHGRRGHYDDQLCRFLTTAASSQQALLAGPSVLVAEH